MRRIAIVSTPRSGSTWFCEMLGRTGSFGVPEEWLFPPMVNTYQALRQGQSFDIAAYLKYIEERTTTPNGIFTINFPINQYQFLRGRGLDLLKLRFDKLIYLSRKDKIAQAYSFSKAGMTGQWRSYFKPSCPIAPQEISAARVVHALQLICDWEEFYEANLRQKMDLELVYEQVSSVPGYLKRVLDECRITGELNAGIDALVQRQSSEADLRRICEIKSYLTGSSTAG